MPHGHARSSMSWCRSRSTRPIPTGCRRARARARRHRRRAARRARGHRRGLGRRTSTPNPRPAQPHEGRRATSSTCRRSRPSCAASSTGSPITRWRRAAWCCAWRCAWATLGPARERVGVRLAGPPPQRMTPARARVLRAARRRLGARQKRGRAARPASRAGVIDGLIDEGALETLVLPPEPVARPPDPDFTQRRILAERSATPPTRCARRSTQRRLLGHAARWRHRLGQDRGLFRGGGREHPARPAVADPDAGDRAHRAVPRPLRRAFRRAAGGMAFARSRRASARAPGRRSRRARCRWWSARARRCFCPTPISASSSSMRSTIPPTSRRTACAITRATWRWCARAIAKIPIVLASATPSVETEVNARRGRYRAPASARALRRPASAVGRSRSTCGAKARRAAASSRRGWPRR